MLRHLARIDLARIESGDPSRRMQDLMAWRPFSEALGVAVAIDGEAASARIGQADLDRWRISFDAALEIAAGNLREKAAPSFMRTGSGLFISQYRDYYDAPRILLKELARQLPLVGAPVAMVPNKACLLLCGADDERALAEMVSAAGQVLTEQSRPLSSEMFRLEGDAWSAWRPPAAAGQELAWLQRAIRNRDYHDQQKALEAAHAKTGEDVFVAPYKLVKRNRDGALLSFSVLADGEPTWLPETDLVALDWNPRGIPLMVGWADFSKHAAHLLEKLSYVLPRYRVLAFPGGDCFEALRNAATTIDAAEA
ncbi:hypothetical protein EZ216_13385 [Ramlibacter humi]|uniref:Uncharacterized protein n=1 Tax=Ramlibacter humi TaxID=2530451 RepID=A0A4Z0BLA1_9BURK|nr:hypothetical protein EZ216_13385 [Ramlibacter humi]